LIPVDDSEAIEDMTGMDAVARLMSIERNVERRNRYMATQIRNAFAGAAPQCKKKALMVVGMAHIPSSLRLNR
jgi:hypothetical protein